MSRKLPISLYFPPPLCEMADVWNNKSIAFSFSFVVCRSEVSNYKRFYRILQFNPQLTQIVFVVVVVFFSCLLFFFILKTVTSNLNCCELYTRHLHLHSKLHSHSIPFHSSFVISFHSIAFINCVCFHVNFIFIYENVF